MNRLKHKKYVLWLVLLFVGFILPVQGCNPKDSDFFSSFGFGDGNIDTGDDIPTFFEITGSWLFIYTYILDACNNQTGEFPAEALVVIVDENDRIIGVVFPDAGDSINGPYNPPLVKTGGYQLKNLISGSFVGQSGKVDVGNGFLAQEFWDGNFSFDDANPPAVIYEGSSLVEVTDSSGNLACTIEYEVTGERMGPLP